MSHEGHEVSSFVSSVFSERGRWFTRSRMRLPALLQFILYWLKLQWIRLCRWMLNPVVSKASSTYHKAVVIGDGLAMGVGDRVTLGVSGGLASRVEDAVHGTRKLRTKWNVLNCGEADSTSWDWLPSGDRKTFYHSVFNSKALADAEVVLVLLGTQDILRGKTGMSDHVLSKPFPDIREQYPPEEFCDTVKNLQQLCLALLHQNPRRQVLVCDILMSVPGSLIEREHHDMVMRVNKQLIDMIQDESIFGKRRPTWVHFSPPKVVHRDWALSSDRVHLSAKGYKAMAQWVLEKVLTAMLRVEWTYLNAAMQKISLRSGGKTTTPAPAQPPSSSS
uniref:SGNH hydrolase-type esterase domain-containing protein n=1 Tax=Rhizochromulina marina TaxID=1034831 RepID=A0A6U0YVQ9_9STRA|mmetsp:Transcript_19447/g.56694  ORF Transcript_19447/g.56694 Transcript_19447/m.56694 type:complete len:333 (+) Transcript_19447:9-1007(+)